MMRTQPIVQLPDPGRSRILYWRIQEDNLVLYPNFMHDRLQHHMSFQELDQKNVQLSTSSSIIKRSTYLFFLHTFITSSLVSDIPKGKGIAAGIFIDPVELCTPYLDDMRQPLEKDSFYPFV
jgi:hypothetical protein